METDESPESAARREMAEETGYQPRELFALEGIQYRRSDGVLINPHPFWTRFDSTQKIYCLEGQTISFVDSNNLESLKLIPTQCDIIQKAISLWKQHGYRVNLEKT